MMKKKYFSRYVKPILTPPNLVELQLESYRLLITEGLTELFKEFSPISDYSGKKFDLAFTKFELTPPSFDEFYAKENKLTLESPLRVMVKLKNKTLSTEKEQEIFLADFPAITAHGTFIINGNERVVVSQLARSFGVFFGERELKGRKYFGAKIIPARGAWVEIESEADGALYVRVDKKRKIPVTSLLRVFGELKTNGEIFDLFKGNPYAVPYIQASLDKDTAKTLDESYVEIYRRLRDGTLASSDNAKDFIVALFNKERYDLSPVGRYRFNKMFDKDTGKKEMERRTLSLPDFVAVISHIITLNNTPGAKGDDIDHLGVRRVRFMGEMLGQRLRMGLARMKRNIQDRMSTIDPETTLPVQIINPRPLQTSIKEFFNTHQLTQYMNQKNILDELEHMRTLSALGPGGLTRERAGFEVRDVHPSHYGRVCPIHTPEGQSIGLILRLSVYARVNDFGIIETPYIKVSNGKVTKEIVYLNALEEENYNIAHAAMKVKEDGFFADDFVEVRAKNKPGQVRLVSKKEVDLIDVASNQPFSVATSLIPFLEHDDANRALMGSNMQKQAVPLVLPQAPLVATGVEEMAARDSGRLIIATEPGEVTYADARKIDVKNTAGKTHEYKLVNFSRTNGFTTFHQRPAVSVGD
ncbi:MAG: DNA-directed RNA polymerase subunit beta, partial [Patescibacteria group bacterium]